MPLELITDGSLEVSIPPTTSRLVGSAGLVWQLAMLFRPICSKGSWAPSPHPSHRVNRQACSGAPGVGAPKIWALVGRSGDVVSEAKVLRRLRGSGSDPALSVPAGASRAQEAAFVKEPTDRPGATTSLPNHWSR